MFELKVIGEFSAAHNLRGYLGKCEELHGHNWKVEVVITGRKLNKTGSNIIHHRGCLRLLTCRVQNYENTFYWYWRDWNFGFSTVLL